MYFILVLLNEKSQVTKALTLGDRHQPLLSREHLTTATAMFREMEMTYWLEQAEAEMSLAPSAH
jgi:hypothetical protein